MKGLNLQLFTLFSLLIILYIWTPHRLLSSQTVERFSASSSNAKVLIFTRVFWAKWRLKPDWGLGALIFKYPERKRSNLEDDSWVGSLHSVTVALDSISFLLSMWSCSDSVHLHWITKAESFFFLFQVAYLIRLGATSWHCVLYIKSTTFFFFE